MSDGPDLTAGPVPAHVAAARMDALIRRKAIECCVSDIECGCQALGGRWYDPDCPPNHHEYDAQVVSSALAVLDHFGLLERSVSGWVQVPDVDRMFAADDSTEADHVHG